MGGYSGAMVVVRWNKTKTLYMTSNCLYMVSIVDNNSNIDLLHCRLKQMSDKGMKVLISNCKLPRLKFVENKLCESCIFKKQKRVSFSKVRRELKEEKLELVHTDVWGPSAYKCIGAFECNFSWKVQLLCAIHWWLN